MSTYDTYDPDSLEALEADIIELNEQLKGVQAADNTSKSATKLVAYVNQVQDMDILVSGSEENTWKELPPPTIEPEKVEQSRCCAIA